MTFIERPIRVRRNAVTINRQYVIKSLTGRNVSTVVLRSDASRTNQVLYEFLCATGTRTRVLSIEFLK